MNSSEFKQFVIERAKEIISEGIDIKETKKAIKKPKSPKLKKAYELKKIPKSPKTSKLPKLKKPLSVTEDELVKESVCSPEKIKILAEEMKKINKKIDLRNPLISPDLFSLMSEENHLQEETKNRWKNLYDYQVPEDEQR
jgi:hypothetical protein